MTEPPPPNPEPMAVLPYSAAPDVGEIAGLAKLSWAAVIVCWIGVGLIASVNVETVLATGPSLFIVALVQVFWAAGRRHMVFCLIAVGHLTICGVFVCLASAFRWGPGKAAMPFLWMSLFWTGLSTLLMYGRRSLASSRWAGGEG